MSITISTIAAEARARSSSPVEVRFKLVSSMLGPVWPVLNWFFGWACRGYGEQHAYDALRHQSLAQLADLMFGEYYEPSTGEPLGSPHQSWTAAVALLWLDGR